MSFPKYLIYDDYHGCIDSMNDRAEALKTAKERSLRRDTEVCIYRAEEVVKATLPTGIEIPAIVMSV